jgi:hypothetical protein
MQRSISLETHVARFFFWTLSHQIPPLSVKPDNETFLFFYLSCFSLMVFLQLCIDELKKFLCVGCSFIVSLVEIKCTMISLPLLLAYFHPAYWNKFISLQNIKISSQVGCIIDSLVLLQLLSHHTLLLPTFDSLSDTQKQ